MLSSVASSASKAAVKLARAKPGLASSRLVLARPATALLAGGMQVPRYYPQQQQYASAAPASARFMSGTAARKIITPDGKGVTPKEDGPKVIKTPAKLTDGQYHVVADHFIDRLLVHLEELQDKRTDVEVEYADGVIKVEFAGVGTYVINKQPPNKQIWLSSPVSGPKRYDYFVLGDGQHEKQDTACGEWLYVRDGTTINELFRNELKIDLSMATGSYEG